MKLCGAKNRSGNPCGLPAMDNGRCRMHGGLSTGPVNPAVKHGLYRKHLTTDELELYDALKGDTNRDDLSGEIAMTRVVIGRCFRAIVEPDGQHWRVPMQVLPQKHWREMPVANPAYRAICERQSHCLYEKDSSFHPL